MHPHHSADKTPAYTTRKAPQVHKPPATTSSYPQTKMLPDQTGRTQ